jgi:hypothetical protein
MILHFKVTFASVLPRDIYPYLLFSFPLALASSSIFFTILYMTFFLPYRKNGKEDEDSLHNLLLLSEGEEEGTVMVALH